MAINLIKLITLHNILCLVLNIEDSMDFSLFTLDNHIKTNHKMSPM